MQCLDPALSGGTPAHRQPPGRVVLHTNHSVSGQEGRKRKKSECHYRSLTRRYKRAHVFLCYMEHPRLKPIAFVESCSRA